MELKNNKTETAVGIKSKSYTNKIKKKRTLISIDEDLYNESIKLGIKISQVAEDGLRDRIIEIKNKKREMEI